MQVCIKPVLLFTKHFHPVKPGKPIILIIFYDISWNDKPLDGLIPYKNTIHMLGILLDTPTDVALPTISRQAMTSTVEFHHARFWLGIVRPRPP